MGFGKFIGATLGWSVFGPIGGLIGFALGSLLDGGAVVREMPQAGRRGPMGRRSQTQVGDFNVALVVLTAAVMKADGKVLKAELSYVKDFFIKQFGKEGAKESLSLLKGLLEKDIPLREVCEQIGSYMQMPMRLQLLHYLFGIAKSDGNVHSSEAEVIQRIARYLRIPSADFESIKAMFYEEVGAAYKILEIDAEASEAELKKAYRRMANRYHPDKVAQLGPDVQKGAKEKFQKIQDAYEQIKKERGMP